MYTTSVKSYSKIVVAPIEKKHLLKYGYSTNKENCKQSPAFSKLHTSSKWVDTYQSNKTKASPMRSFNHLHNECISALPTSSPIRTIVVAQRNRWSFIANRQRWHRNQKRRIHNIHLLWKVKLKNIQIKKEKTPPFWTVTWLWQAAMFFFCFNLNGNEYWKYVYCVEHHIFKKNDSVKCIMIAISKDNLKMIGAINVFTIL